MALALGASVLVACDTWFGAEKPPLPGERISVLARESKLAPDPGAMAQAVMLPAPLANADWPQAGGYANHAMHHMEIGDEIRPAWAVDIGQGADEDRQLIGSPVIGDGRIYTIDTASVVGAYDADTGGEVWYRDLTPDTDDDDHMTGGLAYERGRLYVTTGFAQVVALEAKTGAEIWRQSLGTPMRSAPTVRDGRLFVITVDNKLYALDALDGRTLWTFSAISESASLLGGASPAVDGTTVVAPFSSGELVALRVENGRVLWSDSLAQLRRTDVVSALSHIRSRPVIDRGRVFAISHGDQMVAIDLRSGRRLWDKEIGGVENLWVAGNYLYVITNSAEIVCLSREDGRVLWVTSLPRYEDEAERKKPILWTGPVLASDRLIVAGSHGQALAISPYSGAILGRVSLPDGVALAPIVANRFVYFLANDATLVAYR